MNIGRRTPYPKGACACAGWEFGCICKGTPTPKKRTLWNKISNVIENIIN